MIRSFTCVCALLAGASGLYLYSEKHRTTLLDQQISKIVSDTQAIRERTSMLRAEWALLNQPDRLQGLSTRFLPQLGAMAPTQFVQLAALDKRLPPIGPETPPHPIATPQTSPALVGLKPAAPAAVQPGAAQPGADADSAAIADATPVGPVAALPPPHPAERLAQAKPTRTTARREVQLADAADDETEDKPADGAVAPQAATRRVTAHALPHAHAVAPIRLASDLPAQPAIHARPAVTRVASTYGHPPVLAAAAWRPAHAAWPAPRAVSYSTPVASAPIGSSLGSSLGSGRSSLPAPVPVPDGN